MQWKLGKPEICLLSHHHVDSRTRLHSSHLDRLVLCYYCVDCRRSRRHLVHENMEEADSVSSSVTASLMPTRAPTTMPSPSTQGRPRPRSVISPTARDSCPDDSHLKCSKCITNTVRQLAGIAVQESAK